MGLMTGAIQIGPNALLAYQSALQVIGNNVSNVGTDGYTRQTPILTPASGVTLTEGFQPGGGVALTGLRRNVDESLEDRYRVATGDQASSQVMQDVIGRIESSMNELSDNDLSTLLQSFFDAFSDLQNDPTQPAGRSVILAAADNVAAELSRQREEVLTMQIELNGDLKTSAQRANEISGDIADLNARISQLENSASGSSSALCDQRDQLLRELGELVQIQIRPQPGGSVNVYIGNEPLIQGGLNRGLKTTLDTVDGYPKVTVRFADNNSPIQMRGGKMAGLVESRDVLLVGHVADLDGLAANLIAEVNKVHSQGQGLEGFTDVTGTYDVDDANAALNSSDAGLALKPQNGSFVITEVDQDTGAATDHVITVDLDGSGADDSLNSLVAQINGKLVNAHAEVTGDNKLRLVANTGFELDFSQDSSNTLAALGVNTFFTGTDAKDLAVNSTLTANPRLLAAATQRTPGDGSNAANLFALGSEPIGTLNNQSISDYYNLIVSNVAVRGAAAKATTDGAAAVTSALASQREAVSGVNLDEETVSLLKLERAFEGAARYTTTINGLMDQLLALVS